MADLPELEMFDERAGMSATKVFVGGLPQQTTNASLMEAFVLFEPAMCEVMMDRVTGRSRGFGFVHFADTDNAQTLLLSGPHAVDGKEVSVSPCWEKGAVPHASSTPRSSSAGSESGSQLKVFVGGISQHSTVESLNAYFSQFGSADSYIMMDKTTGRSRGFGFVNFMDEDTMNSVLQSPHEIDGVPVTVSAYRDTNPKGKAKGKGKAPMGEAGVVLPSAATKPAQAAPAVAGQDIHSTLGHALSSVQALISSLTGQAPALQPQATAAAPVATAMVRAASGRPVNRASDKFKIWVGGLSQATTRESLNNYFSQFGYADSYVMMDKASGRSRGFGFVTFAEEPVMETVLGFQHEIDGVLVTCSPYQSSGTPPSPHAGLAVAGPSASPAAAAAAPTHAGEAVGVAEALLSNLQTLLTEKLSTIAAHGAGVGAAEPVDGEESPVKVFVGGLTQSVTGDLLHAAFAPYSPLQCEVMLDKITGRSRGFGFVTVASPQMAQLMMSTPHVIDGKQVEVSECWAKGTKPSTSKGAGKSHRSSPY